VSAEESVEGVFEGDDLTVAFNPSYLLDGVKQFVPTP